MILILTNKWDITADFVVSELTKRDENFVRINSEDVFGEYSTINLPDFSIKLSKNGYSINIVDEVKAIWNRRPGKPYDDIPNKQRPSEALQQFINDQWFTFYESLQIIDDIKWINHPKQNDIMENKIRQLYLANKLGFCIPETIVSNDPNKIKLFAEKRNYKIIAKALYSPLIEEKEQDLFIFTNKIKKSDLNKFDEIKVSPIIFQKCLEPKIDYRVTVIGNKVFAAEIKYLSDNIDWRTSKKVISFEHYTLPDEIEYLCIEYLKKSKLLFGAIDLVKYNNTFYFLEINPNGEWGWLQKSINMPIAQTLCDLMIDKNG